MPSVYHTYTREGHAFSQESFASLYQDSLFTDVRLVSSDGLAIECHRVVLAAASPFLKSSLIRLRDGQRDLKLEVFSHNVLLAVLDLIYKGEAKVRTEERVNFCAAVRYLALKVDPKLKSLIECPDEDDSDSSSISSMRAPSVSKPLSQGVSESSTKYCLISLLIHFISLRSEFSTSLG